MPKLTTNFDNFTDPNYSDFEAGREDASEFNPVRREAARTGRALEAYNAGYEFGEACMGDYYDGQEE